MLRRIVQLNCFTRARQTLLLVLGGALLVILVPAIAFGDEPQKNVLIFYADDPSLPANVLINEAIRTNIKDHWKSPIQIYDEGQDSFRIPNEKYEAEMVALLQRKYEGVHLDVIFAVGPPTLRFLMKYRSQLFTDSPIVFLATDQSRIADLNFSGANITGVSTRVEVAPTLDLALALHPQTQKVVVAGGNAPFDKGMLALAQKEFRAYESKIAFTYLTDLTLEEMRQRLAVLPDKTIVIFLSFNNDITGKNYVSRDVASLLASSSSAPIYGQSEVFLGHGIVGGRLLSFEALGTAAGELGLRVLAGESAQSIAPQTIPSVTMVDWRELRRWRIDEGKMPAGTIVRFKELSFWEQYKWRIGGVISLCILEAVLIVLLLISRARRRQAEQENKRLALVAEAERRRLDEVVSNVPGVVWESREEPGTNARKTHFVSDYVEKMLGYSIEEWSAPGFALTIVPEEDRERLARETETILESGKAGSLQFRWTAKDGSLLWVEAQVTAICDAAGKTIGLRGVTMDVTERKLAEELLRESDERLKQAISVARFGVFEHDHLAGILHTSPLTREIHDWGEEDTSSLEALVTQLHPEDRETFIDALQRAHDPSGEGFFSREYRIVLDGGKVRWVSARAQTFFEGENGARHPVRTVGAELDITERKEADEALRTAAEEVSRLKNQLQAENIYLQEEIKLAHNVDEIVGQSNAIKYVLFKIEQVAETNATVLILGETGTGKELVARAIHSQSSRRDRPLVKVNCAALSASLIESELFGHEKGAFTGASARKIGRFELANGATLFLDEIGELPLELQAKLLRVIQEGEFERLGSSKTIKVEVRIIAATNRNMKAEIEKGSFREDLWYRLNVFPITVPPLRQRKEDIPPMVEHFVNGFSKKLGKPINSISAATLKKLQDYSWPGNVRELANVLERAVINAQGSVLHIADQFEQLQSEESSISIKTLEEMEKEYITRILDDTSWRIEGPNGAARILGLNPSTLRTRMLKLGIQKSVRSFAGGSGSRN